MMCILLRTILLCAALLAVGACSAAEQELLEPEKAFAFSARMLDPERVEIRYRIAPGYYMYRDKFAFTAEPSQVVFEAPQFPPAAIHKDEFFGEVHTFRGDLRFVVPLKVTGDSISRFAIKAVSQGCADIGVCYPPQEQRAELTLSAFGASGAEPGKSVFLPAPASSATPALLAEDAAIAELFKGGYWALIASFFVFGLLLSLTPCVFPMIPILSGILAPHGTRLTHARGLALSSAYVLGMAITYALAGVAAAMLGGLLSAALQHPWVLSAFAAVFVLLALSMFGLYELQLPTSLQSRLTTTSNKLHGGHFFSVFIMGVLSALIVGPCVAAPLAGALLYISQSGDVVLGASALFVMALGMGVPLLIVGASAGALLPKAGPWMETVKRFFGVLLLAVAIFLVSPLLPPAVHLAAWAVLLIIFAVFVRALDPLPVDAPGYRRLFKGVGVIALLAGAAYLIGALAGGRDVLQPLAGLHTGASANLGPVHFKRVDDLVALDAEIKAATGRPVMLDFYADWCISCKEMERYTFSDSRVRAKLEGVVLLQADVTENKDQHKQLLRRFSLFGPPGIIFFDRQGNEIKGLRVIGFQSAEKFAKTLDAVFQ